ncbi:hypothetical protein [Fodinicola feengrottensis]|uniref:hypothetical protein n=1 Tax=Fodinicola feengrottensis TaxID=435914 RepID=UPI0024417E87|nr:hypothetical protein [Fodinicola feengrottensis]
MVTPTIRPACSGSPPSWPRCWPPPGLSPDRLDAAVHQAAKAAAARGIVGVVELEHDFNVAAWTRRVRAGTTFLRVECGVYKAHLDDAIERGWRTGDVQPTDTGGLVEMGRLKVITDGSLNTRTAYCHQPYLDSAGKEIGRGDLVVPPKELVSADAPSGRPRHRCGCSCDW